MAYRREQRRAVAGQVIDRDETRQARRADPVAQQRLAILNRARAQILAVEVETEARDGKIVGASALFT